MLRKFKNAIAILTCALFMFSSLAPVASASTASQIQIINGITYTIKILKDDSTTKQVSIDEKDRTTITTYNKVTDDFKSEVTEKATKAKTTSTVNVKKLKDSTTTITENNITPTAVSSYSSSSILRENGDSWWGYHYIIYSGSPNSWFLRLDKNYVNYKNVNQTSSNLSNLNSFASSVNSMMSNEVAVASIVGSATAGAIASLIAGSASLGIGAVIGLFISLGISISAAYPAYNAWQNSKDADYYFRLV